MKSYAEKNEQNLYAFFVNYKAKRVPWRKNSLESKRKFPVEELCAETEFRYATNFTKLQNDFQVALS